MWGDVKEMTERYTNLIGGQWVGADEWFEDINPADREDIVGLFPMMTKSHALRALDAACAGLRVWRRTSLYKRGVILRRAAAILRERLDEIARDVTRENGKLLREARGEVARSADFFEYYGAFGRWPEGNILSDERDGVQVLTHREPVGVVLAITPWNDPILTPARKIAPALIAGNSVIIKPAFETPLSVWHLARALEEAGLPPGVLNVITGRADILIPPLLENSEVHAITFTGSTEVGLYLLDRASRRNVRVQTEMGGKNTTVVLADAPLEQAVAAVIMSGFGQCGQRCTATSRVLIHENIIDDFVEQLVDRVSRLRVGPGLDESSDVGPVISEAHLKKVVSYIESGRSGGVTVLHGGRRLEEGGLGRGWFVEPTVLADVQEDLELWREEIFGPVVALRRIRSLEEAIDIVNNTRYGLSSAIFTRDLEAAHHFAKEVETGCVGVNVGTSGWDVHIPFGGFKDSGSPFKEHGIEGLQFYTRVKSVAMKVAGL